LVGHAASIGEMRTANKILRKLGMKLVGHVVGIGEMRTAYKILVGRPEEKKRSYGRHRHRSEDNIRMNLKETG
jgi:hypothetical protein